MKAKIGFGKLFILVSLCLFFILLSAYAWGVYGIERPTKVKAISDENAIILTNGRTVKLWGVEASRSSENFLIMKEYLKSLLDGRNLWVEYNNSNKDGTLAWVWVGCESRPKLIISFLFGSKENPIGCKKGALVNEQIIKMGWSKVIMPESGEKMKYLERLNSVEK